MDMKSGVALLAVAMALLASGRAGARTVEEEQDALAVALQADIRSYVRLLIGSAEPVFCVAIDPGDARQSPSREFVARIVPAARRVVRSAECEVRKRTTVELATGAAALVVSGGPVEWISADEAWVTVVQVQSRGESLRKQYRVVREAGRWTCLGPILKLSPA